jgi:hypothetical protein
VAGGRTWQIEDFVVMVMDCVLAAQHCVPPVPGA